jgi:selenoprotein W-related protein
LLLEFTTDIQALTLVPSGGGVFDVRVGDELIFSKFKAGHFPKPDEVKALMRERLKS